MARFPEVGLHLGGRNLGFGAGVNAAVRTAALPWDAVWVLNPDTIVRPGALDLLVEAMRDHDLGMVSPLIVQSRDGAERIWFAGGDVDLARGRTSHGGMGRSVDSIEPGFRLVGFVSGAAPLISRPLWEAVGGFSEHYFLYWEDADLSLRATAAGFRLGVQLRAVVLHKEGGSSGGGVSATYSYFIQRNRLWVAGGLSRRLGVAFGAGRRTTLQHLLVPLRRSTRAPSPFRSAAASVRGLLAGLAGPRVRPAALRMRGSPADVRLGTVERGSGTCADIRAPQRQSRQGRSPMFIGITNTPRDYAWGSRTAIAELLGRAGVRRPGGRAVARRAPRLRRPW